ncbi:MAG: efflux transporter protein [Hyphomicrobiales bacterium]|nr:efflux transporter protein [Hyphomicrobiales bacterium]
MVGKYLGALAALAAAFASPASAQDAGSFYKGKQITIIVGSSPGGGYDTYARLIARHMPKHIPGAPTVIVQNMPGAGSNVAANYIYNVAPKDGTIIGAYQSGVVLEPLLGKTPIKHDPSKSIYLGSANDDVYICLARADSKVHEFKDLFSNELLVAASQSSSTSDYPAVINAVLGTKFKIVSGYPGSREISLAVERGEAQGACGLAWPSINVTQPGWFNSGAVKVIVQTHATGHPELNAKGVPLAHTFARNDDERAMLDLFFSQSRFGRPYVVAPEVPKDRVAVLRKAFADSMADPELRAEAARARLDAEPVLGEDLQTLVAKVYASPPAIIARTRKAVLGE